MNATVKGKNIQGQEVSNLVVCDGLASQHPGPLGEREPPPQRLGEGHALDHPPLRRAGAPAAAV